MAGFIELFRPDQSVHGVVDIDLAGLLSRGFSALMLDLDNTLLPWKNSIVPDSSREWIETAKNLGLKLCIVSNTHNPRRLMNISHDLDIPAVYGALKPRRYGFEKAASMLECELSRSVVVGDQLLTDILGGNMAGMHTILVKPMHPKEFIGTKLSRLVEKGIFAVLRRGTKTHPT